MLEHGSYNGSFLTSCFQLILRTSNGTVCVGVGKELHFIFVLLNFKVLHSSDNNEVKRKATAAGIKGKKNIMVTCLQFRNAGGFLAGD